MSRPLDKVRPRLRPIALPTEHGGWGFLLEPAVAGLIAAPSAAGAMLAAAALGVFLARHPLGLAAADRRRGRRTPRSRLAERFTIGYGSAAAAALAVAALLADPRFWIALAVAAPLALLQLWHDVRRQSRALAAELAGAVAMAGLAPAILLAGGRGWGVAAVMWALLGGRSVPAILYVRTRLRRAREQPASAWPPLVAHLGALAAAGALVAGGVGPWLAAAAMGLLLVRALLGLAPGARTTRAIVVGVQEMVVGAAVAVMVGIGLR